MFLKVLTYWKIHSTWDFSVWNLWQTNCYLSPPYFLTGVWYFPLVFLSCYSSSSIPPSTENGEGPCPCWDGDALFCGQSSPCTHFCLSAHRTCSAGSSGNKQQCQGLMPLFPGILLVVFQDQSSENAKPRDAHITQPFLCQWGSHNKNCTNGTFLLF